MVRGLIHHLQRPAKNEDLDCSEKSTEVGQSTIWFGHYDFQREHRQPGGRSALLFGPFHPLPWKEGVLYVQHLLACLRNRRILHCIFETRHFALVTQRWFPVA